MNTALAGGLATAAVGGAMAVARRQGWTRLHFPRILGTVLGEDTPRTRALGLGAFLANGLLFASAYRQLSRVTGEQPTVARGAAVGLVHGLVAAGMATAFSPLHPHARKAGLTRWLNHRPPRSSVATLLGAHVLYGAVLGALG